MNKVESLKKISLDQAEDREIVKAMADMTAHGAGGCDCGCGCN
jgi:hypothetical protein